MDTEQMFFSFDYVLITFRDFHFRKFHFGSARSKPTPKDVDDAVSRRKVL